MSLKNDPSHYDAYYFAHCCGEPYERAPIWLQLFNGIADSIVRRIQPRTALDVGCAMGFLVEGLRDRAVDAYGIDISEYAVQRVRPDLQPYCHVGSILDPLPRRYDLIVSIEVLEHLPAQMSELAVRNLCVATNDILFSSTPFDYSEPSHLNVQPPEYWAELFAINGFVCDIDFDASFITPWARRFRKSQEPLHRIVRQYERHIWALSQENRELRKVTLKMRDQLADKESSNSDSSQSLQIPLTTNEHKPQPSNAQLLEIRNKPGQQLLTELHRIRVALARKSSPRNRWALGRQPSNILPQVSQKTDDDASPN